MSEAPPTLHDGRYRIDQVLGVGGMSVVLLAFDTRMGVHRAVKLLNRRFANSPQVRERFEIEASAQAGLRHPNILMVHDVLEDDSGVYMVMELAERGSLAERVKTQGPLAPRDVADIGIKLAGALGAAHAAGVIHRDIKPENVLVDRNGELKIADFGIARVVARDHSLTRTGMVMGTWAYMPPEQRESARQVDARSDIYALGGCLYFLVTGRQPPALHNTQSHAQAFADIPAALADVLAKCTCFEPEDRYQTCTELRDALAAVAPTLGAEPVVDFEPPTEPPQTLAPAVGDLSTYVQEHPEIAATLAPFLGMQDDGPTGTAVPSATELASDPAATFLPELLDDDGPVPGATLDPVAPAQPPTASGRRLAALLVGAPAVIGLAVLGMLKLVQPADTAPPPAVEAVGAGQVEAPAAPVEEATVEEGAASQEDATAGDATAGDGGIQHAGEPEPAAAAAEGDATAPATGASSSDGSASATPAGTTTGGSATDASTSAGSSTGGGPRIITVIPSTKDTTASTPEAAPAAAGSTGAAADPTGTVVVRTVPSGATVLEGGQVLSRSGRGYRLPVGSHVLEIRSPSGEQTRRAVQVDKDATVEICYSFDTNSACSDAQTSD